MKIVKLQTTCRDNKAFKKQSLNYVNPWLVVLLLFDENFYCVFPYNKKDVSNDDAK